MKKIYIILLHIFIISSVFAQNADNLEQYIDYAIKNNPSIQVAEKSYEASLEKIDYLSALPDPTLSFGYFISSVKTANGSQLGKVSVSQMFPWFGSLSAREKQAAVYSNSLYNRYIDKQNEISFEVKKSYFGLYFFSKKRDLIVQQITLFEKLESEALTKVENSKATVVDVLVFQMAIQELELNLENVKFEIEKNQADFNLLLNREETADIILPETLLVEEMKILTLDSILENNHQIKASEDLISMYNLKYKADKLNNYPNFGIGLDYIFIANDATSPNSGKDAIMPMFTISIPIWTKKNKSLNRSNQILIEQSQQQNIAVTNSLSSEFQSVKYNYEKAYRELELYNQLIAKAEQSLQIIYSQYTTSSADYDQIIFLQNTILRYKINKYKAIVDIKIFESKFDYLAAY